MNLEIKEAKQAESSTRKRDLEAARRGESNGSLLALARSCGGLPYSPIRFDEVKPYPLQPDGDDSLDDQ